MGMEFVNDLAASNIIDYSLASNINRNFNTTRNNQGVYNAFVRVSAPDSFTRTNKDTKAIVQGGLLTGAATLAGITLIKKGKKVKNDTKSFFSKIFNKKAAETVADAASTGAKAGTVAGAETVAKEATGLKKVWKAIPKPLKVIGGIVAGGALALNAVKKIMIKKYMEQNQAAMEAQAMANADAQLQNIQA